MQKTNRLKDFPIHKITCSKTSSAEVIAMQHRLIIIYTEIAANQQNTIQRLLDNKPDLKIVKPKKIPSGFIK